MLTSTRRRWMMVALLLLSVLSFAWSAYATDHLSNREHDLLAAPYTAFPMPSDERESPIDPEIQGSGCRRVLPPGEEVCCIHGHVYLDGEPVAGAEVEIASAHDVLTTERTVLLDDEEPPDFYSYWFTHAMTATPDVGDVITVTARYQGHEQSTRYTVQPGSWQVDVVLNRTRPDDYKLDHMLSTQDDLIVPDVPSGLAVLHTDSETLLYAADSANQQVHVFQQVADESNQSDMSFELRHQWSTIDGQTRERFAPRGIAVDTDGRVYVTDGDHQVLQVYTTSGEWLARWGEAGHAPGQFASPVGVAVESQGYVYVTDIGTHRVEVFNRNGEWQNGWGGQGNASGQFQSPWGIAVHEDAGRIAVADMGNHRVQLFNRQGVWQETWGEMGDDPGQVHFPVGFAFDDAGDGYVADMGNGRMQKMSHEGVWLTDWSNPHDLGFPIAFVSSRGGNLDLYQMNADGSFVESLTHTPTHEESPAWSPDGRKIVFSARYDGQSDLFVMNHDGTKGITLMTEPTHETMPAWSPGGKQIAFVSDRDGQHEIYLLAADGSDRPVRLTNHAASDTHPSWSPDGNQIAFASDRDGQYEIYLIAADHDVTEEPTRLTHASGEDTYPAWSPDGASLVFVSTRSGDDELYTMLRDGSEETRRTSSPAKDTEPTWSSAPRSVPDTPSIFVGRPWGLAAGQDEAIFAVFPNDHRIQVFRPMHYTRPIATIASLSDDKLTNHDMLTAYGYGHDSDETPGVTAYRWTLDGAGSEGTLLGEEATLSLHASTLPIGMHTLVFQVSDDEGEWSAPVARTLTIDGGGSISLFLPLVFR